MDEERTILVNLQLEKAHETFRQAESNMTLGIWEVVVNRLYYSCFHAVSALLIKYGHSFKTHQGIGILFNQHFVKPGIVTVEQGRILSLLQEMRERADYNCIYSVAEEDVRPLIEPVKELLETVERLIREERQ